jgi:CoA:oxalate CoA-transferase
VPVGEDMWRRLARAMARADLIEDPRFADNTARLKHIDALERIITDWLQAQPSDAAALATLQQHRVPCAPVLSVSDAIRHPHLVERYTVRDVEDAALGRFQVPGPLLHLAGEPPVMAPAAPMLGEHNADVLSRHLGLDAAQIAALERDRVLRRAAG